MPAYFHIAPAQLARRHLDALASIGIFDPQQFVGQLVAKAAMHLADADPRGCPTSQPSTIDPSLDLDMRLGFELQVSFAKVRAVIVLQGAFDIDRMGIVALDQVAVIAVHRTDQIGQRRHDPLGQTPAKTGRTRRQLDREIRESASEAGAFGYQQRLHQAHGFFAVGNKAFAVRSNVRFYVRISLGHLSNNSVASC